MSGDRDWTFWAAVGGVVLVIGAAVFGIWYDYEHPCLRWGPPRECVEMHCTSYDSHGMCMGWFSTSYDCSECLERAPSRNYYRKVAP